MCSNTDALYQDRRRPILGALPKDALQCPWGLPTSAATLEYKLYQDIKNKQKNTTYKINLQINMQTKYNLFEVLATLAAKQHINNTFGFKFLKN